MHVSAKFQLQEKIKGLNSLPLLTVLSDMSGPTTHRAENGIGHNGLCLLDLLQLPGIMHLNITIKESTRTNNTEVIHYTFNHEHNNHVKRIFNLKTPRAGQHSRAAQSTYGAKKLHLCAEEHQTLKKKTVPKHGLETLRADITCIPLTQFLITSGKHGKSK